jgi:hypothetical protein
MRFGSKVMVLRGSDGNPPGTKGCLREVQGILIGWIGPDALVRLDEDDPFDACGIWVKRGDVGHWSKSVVHPLV